LISTQAEIIFPAMTTCVLCRAKWVTLLLLYLMNLNV
jgi:hypothetical protein